MASWSLNASGEIPAAADPSVPAPDVVAREVALYEAIKAVLEDPQYGAQASSFMGSHVSGSLHQPDA